MIIFTMNEAAKQLRISRRYFQDWLRDHPLDANGRPFYARLGRRYTFDEDDLRRIREAAREEERLRLRPRGPSRKRPLASRRAETLRTSDQALADVRDLLKRPHTSR